MLIVLRRQECEYPKINWKITEDDDGKSIQEQVGDLKFEEYVTIYNEVLTTGFREMKDIIADN